VTTQELSAEAVGLPRFEIPKRRRGEIFELSSHSRAREALELALKIEDGGFNVFVVGENRSGRMTATIDFLSQQMGEREAPPDWLYLANFRRQHRPRPVSLPAGRGRELNHAMAVSLGLIITSIAKAFTEDSYRKRVEALSRMAGAAIEDSLEPLRVEARGEGLELVRSEKGLGFAPVDAEGKPLEPESLDEEARERLEKAGRALMGKLAEASRKAAGMQAELAERVQLLNRQLASVAVAGHLNSLREQFSGHPAVQRWLDEFEGDILDNLAQIRAAGDGREDVAEALRRRYAVNLMVDRADLNTPEVVLEPNPSLERLFGRIEYRQVEGTLVTDHSMIRPGALHRANGGALVLRAEAVAREEGVWEALKAALRDGAIRVTDRQRASRIPVAGAPDPKPIPLSLRVVLVGSPQLYYSFFAIDPDLQAHFKVKADIDPDMRATPSNLERYAGLICEMAEKQLGRGCRSDAVQLLLGFSARRAGFRDRLSARFELISDILTEAEHHHPAEAEDLDAEAVRAAFAARLRRNARVEDRLQENISRGVVMIDTSGSVVGQVNALTVRDIGDHVFGLPSRITARASVGRKGLVNIERDVALGGPIQQKAVMVLQGFMAGHFARRRPLSFNCSLTFEQSYGGVEGDSASLAELLAVLSDLAGAPLRQDIAVTGSVNQHGRVQAVGGASHKIEGFFRSCRDAGELTGSQGVILPAANANSIVLMPEVSEALAEGRFHVWTVESAEDAIALMTGTPAGALDGDRDEDGEYPADSIYGAVARRLDAFNEILARSLPPGLVGES
jgi:predicted ATP-dependent protease